MPSILHAQLLQQLSKHSDLLTPASSDSKPVQWKGRSILETNEVRTELQQLLKQDDHDEKNDSQLLERICTLCNVEESHKSFLKSFCNTSPQEVAKALTEAIVDTATEEKQIDDAFYQELQEWVEEGEEGEEKAQAAEIIIQALKTNASELDLSYLGLKSLPNALKHLTQIEKLDLSANDLTTLPDIFDKFNNLQKVDLNHNSFEHFPKTLFCIDQPLSVSINNTLILNTFLTPSLEKKLSMHDWKIIDNNNSIFSDSKFNFLLKTKRAKKNNLSIEDYIKIQRIQNDDDRLEKEVHEVLLKPKHQHDVRIQNKTDLKDRVTNCNFSNIRLLSCGDQDMPINIYGCATLTNERPPSKHERMGYYLHNLSFIYSEVDTLISLVDRDKNNKPFPIVSDSAGTKIHHPTKVLSMPITDFCPPRFNHFLTLAKELSPPLPSKLPKGILMFCNAGRGRTGTMMTAAKMIDKFKRLDTDSKKQMLNVTRDFTPNPYNGIFPDLNEDIKTTSYVGNIVQNLRKLEQETTTDQAGMAIETHEQFESLEILQCLLGLVVKLKETPPISDDLILETINKANFMPETLEDFFQIDYTQPTEKVILDAIKQLHMTLTHT